MSRKPADLSFEEFTELIAGAYSPDIQGEPVMSDWQPARSCTCGAEITYGLAQVRKQPFLHSSWCIEYRDTRQQETSEKGNDDTDSGDKYDPWNC